MDLGKVIKKARRLDSQLVELNNIISEGLERVARVVFKIMAREVSPSEAVWSGCEYSGGTLCDTGCT